MDRHCEQPPQTREDLAPSGSSSDPSWPRWRSRTTAVAIALLAILPTLLIGADSLSTSNRLSSIPTNGLIRWWPNLFDAREALTGQEGVVMGVLPQIAAGMMDDTPFGRKTGWVQLKPSVTNRVFTASFWLRWDLYPHPRATILSQEDNRSRWRFGLSGDGGGYGMFSKDIPETAREDLFGLPLGWNHIAISVQEDGKPLYWCGGKLFSPAHPRHLLEATEWLAVGNGPKGDTPWKGGIRDLRIYDRVLAEKEVQDLLTAGLPSYAAGNTLARRVATDRGDAILWTTNVGHISVHEKIYRHYTTEHGLPGNMVQCLHQSRDGFLWIGTEDGLSRFDGRAFRNYTPQNTPALEITGHDISCLAEEENGTLWVGTYGGLLKIQNGKCFAITNGLPRMFVQQLLSAGDGSLWVAGVLLEQHPRGPTILRRYHPSFGTSSVEVIVPGQLRRIVAQTNTLWLATEGPSQLLSWDGRARSPSVAVNVYRTGVSMGWAIASNAPASLRAHAWVDLRNGTNEWLEVSLSNDGPRFCWLNAPESAHPKPSPWSGPSASGAFVGGRSGLAQLSVDGLETIDFQDNPSPLDISAMCGNREGGVWFGTEEDGLHFVQNRLIQMITTRNGLAANDVRSIAANERGDTWVATSRGLNYSESNAWRLAPEHGPKNVVSISPQGNIWISGTVLSPTAVHVVTKPGLPPLVLGVTEWGEPRCLRFSKAGRLWTLCDRGLTWVTPVALITNNQTLQWDPARQPAVRVFRPGQDLPRTSLDGLIVDPDESVWVGTQGQGLIHVTADPESVSVLTNAWVNESCVPLHLDDQGGLWLATARGLVRKLGARFQCIRSEDGMPHDIFYDVVEDDDHRFWLPGKRGIHRVDRREVQEFFDGRRERVGSLTLGVADGLLTPECSSRNYPGATRDRQGRIWIPTRNGLAVIEPWKVESNTQPVPAVIDKLIVNQRDVDIAGSHEALFHTPSETTKLKRTTPVDVLVPTPSNLELSAGSGRRLEIHFAGISLTDAARIRFRYQLEGHDERWLPQTDLRFALYTNLRPGNYRFRLQAANSHGLWNPSETVLVFTIEPFFWQTLPFYATLTLVVGGLVLLAHRRRLAAARHHQELQHEQSVFLEKNRLAADMHDELGAGLTRIAILGETAKGRLSESDETYLTLEAMTQSARNVASGISELVWATNPDYETLEDLAIYLRGYAARQFEGTDIVLQMNFPNTFPAYQLSAKFRRNILLAWKEAIANALKHSKATTVTVRFCTEKGKLQLAITDNGCGLDLSAVSAAGNGLGNIRRRMQDLGGMMKVSKAPNRGTLLEIEVPLGSEAPSSGL